MSQKRPRMTLDLNHPPTKRKPLIKPSPILSSPDVQKLRLASPDLEKFITNPHSLVTPTQVFFPKNVTEEQELYARGFVDALAQLQQDSTSDCSSSAPELSTERPIDMENQEKIKLERKRQRNRIAASKCRKRKLERIAKLEDKVKVLKGENDKLGEVLDKLRCNVEELKGRILGHVQGGCEISVGE